MTGYRDAAPDDASPDPGQTAPGQPPTVVSAEDRLRVERDALRARVALLESHARALVAAVEQSAELPDWRLSLCSVCGALATERDSEESACDQHLDILDSGEKVATDCAAPLRALRAMLARAP